MQRISLLAALVIAATLGPVSQAFALVGDFNGDGRDDLAIGVPGEDVGPTTNAGAANVVYGSGSGLTSTGAQVVTQGNVANGAAEAGDRLGAALAAQNFNSNVADDLAIGVPGENIGPTTDAGAVNAVYSSGSSLTSTGAQVIWQGNVAGGTAEAGDRFGAALVGGAFDGGFGDLAIGTPGENVGPRTDAGVVNVVYGSVNGLTSTNTQVIMQGSIASGAAEAGDRFGAALASGDQRLEIGIPGEDIGSIFDAGGADVIAGGAAGLSTSLAFLSQVGGAGTAEAEDRFGEAVAAGDFNGDGTPDPAAGAPDENIGSATDAGSVNVFDGAALGGQGTLLFQGNLAVGAAETGDVFGNALAPREV
jgi:FG-GAP repeat